MFIFGLNLTIVGHRTSCKKLALKKVMKVLYKSSGWFQSLSPIPFKLAFFCHEGCLICRQVLKSTHTTKYQNWLLRLRDKSCPDSGYTCQKCERELLFSSQLPWKLFLIYFFNELEKEKKILHLNGKKLSGKNTL